jgi:hypothetical protein
MSKEKSDELGHINSLTSLDFDFGMTVSSCVSWNFVPELLVSHCPKGYAFLTDIYYVEKCFASFAPSPRLIWIFYALWSLGPDRASSSPGFVLAPVLRL